MTGDYGKAQDDFSSVSADWRRKTPECYYRASCTLKYVSSENFSIFRSTGTLGGFLCPSWLFHMACPADSLSALCGELALKRAVVSG